MTASGRKIIGCEINQASPALRMDIPRGPGTIPETDKKQQAGKAWHTPTSRMVWSLHGGWLGTPSLCLVPLSL